MAEIDVREINKILENPSKAIFDAERTYSEFISRVADRVVESEKVRIILLAGPSGSGKTTSANMICDALKKRGVPSLVLSLDDFYRDALNPEYPRTETGERDFESPLALNLADLTETLVRISEEREFYIPKYDFKIGARVSITKHEKMLHGCVVIEGLHALNPLIFENLCKEKLLKVFISVSTNINDGKERIISGRKIRFVRRMVRDSIYRAADAEKTLAMWKNVLIGEDEHLYPYRKNADIDYDTFHVFEPAIMRPFAERLISSELAERDPYAKTVLTALTQVKIISDTLLPETSLIREFIPGGKYEELY